MPPQCVGGQLVWPLLKLVPIAAHHAATPVFDGRERTKAIKLQLVNEYSWSNVRGMRRRGIA